MVTVCKDRIDAYGTVKITLCSTKVTKIILGYAPEKEAPVMGKFSKTATDEGVELNWEQATDNIGISHYRVMKNGEFLYRAETFDGYHRVSFTDANGSIGDRYTIVAFDAAGNISQEVEAK